MKKSLILLSIAVCAGKFGVAQDTTVKQLKESSEKDH